MNFQSSRPDRDAWATIRGYVYQVDTTIDRWLNLQPGQVLELERGEDIDIVSEAIQTTDHVNQQRCLEQVKHRTKSLTLQSPEVIAALVNFFEHYTANPGVSLYFRFVTNAHIAHERHSTLLHQLPALKAWEVLRQEQRNQTNQLTLLHGIRSLLISLQEKQKPQDIHTDIWRRFRTFVREADDKAFLTFICKVEWGMEAADANSLRQLLQQRLQTLHYARDPEHANTIYVQMFFTVFERLTQAGLKRLTVEDREQVLARPSFGAGAQTLLEVIDKIVNTLEERVSAVEERVGTLEEHTIIVDIVLEQQAGQLDNLQSQLEQIQKNKTMLPYGEYFVPSVDVPPLTKQQNREHAMPHPGRRLIEDLFPSRAVSVEAAREKSVRHRHISTLHLWWARRPTVAARAAVYGVLIPAPTTDEARRGSKDFMKKLCQWDFPQDILEQARLDILAAHKGTPPRVLDMFSGGGSIPLEALRLGCETYAVDLNPVAYIIGLCTLDYPQRYGSSFVADVRRWGTWVIEQSRKRIIEYYPSVTGDALTKNGKQQNRFVNKMDTINVNDSLVPIAYLWTRTVHCSDSKCGAIVPLVRQTWLRRKVGNYVALRAFPDQMTRSVRFEVVQASKVEELGFDPATNHKNHQFICLHCGVALDQEYIKMQGSNGKLGQKLIAVVYTQQTSLRKIYLADENILNGVDQDKLLDRIDALCDEYELSLPREPIPHDLTGGLRYGLTRFKDLFTPRQLISLLTFIVEVRHAYHAMLDDGMEPKRAAAITTYLGVMINHLANHNSSICDWDPTREMSRQTYTRAALPMTWSFAEINPCTEGLGNPMDILNRINNTIEALVQSGQSAHVKCASALKLPFSDHTFDAIITDPPYYNNISYAELSDFFYIWLKRSIGFLYPEHLRASLTPKQQEEAITTNSRDQNENDTNQNYEKMITQAFIEARRVLKPGAPLVCIHPYTPTRNMPVLSAALQRAGFVIVETWQLSTRMVGRPGTHEEEEQPSDIILVARSHDY